MQLAQRILVIDDSRCMLQLLGQILKSHCRELRFADSCATARQQLEQDPEIDLVICDVMLPDGNGFDLLQEIAGVREPLPRFLLITARWAEADGQRARDLGAVAYLSKPVSLQDIRNALASGEIRPREPRRRTTLRARVVDPEHREQQLSFEIHNISTSGMLLDTKGPLPMGAELEFEIVHAGSELVRGRGTVVRAQQPSWLDVSGCALRFDWIESLERLAELIDRADWIPGSA
jgi:CheY-like chemotaxis protein